MKTKLVYIVEREDIEVLRKAKSIINLLYNAEVEFEDEAVEQDLLSEFGDIEDMCIDGLVNEGVVAYNRELGKYDDEEEEDE